MKITKALSVVAAAAALSLGLTPGASLAQDYPSKPITFLVPYAAGGNGDIVARIVAEGLQKRLGKPVVIDNRPGAGGNIGAAQGTRAAPDGYTIMLATNTHAINQNLFPDAGYDLLTDFASVSLLTRTSTVLLVPSASKAASAKEFIDEAKAKPGALNFGSGGNGTSGHAFMALFMLKTDTDLTHIPYAGEAASYTDLIAGRVQAVFGAVASSSEMVKAGQLRALAIAAPERSAVLPDVPTLAETGVEGVDAYMWQGIVVPKGVPEDIVAKLNTAVTESLKDEALRAKLTQQGLVASPSTPQEFHSMIETDLGRWGEVIKAAGIKIN